MFIDPIVNQITPVEQFIRKTDAAAKRALYEVASAHKIMFLECWDESKITAQAKCDFMGQGAYKLFASSKATQEYLYTWLPNYKPLSVPTNRDAIINEDGTVTIKFKKLVDGVIVWENEGSLTPVELKAFDDEVKEFERV